MNTFHSSTFYGSTFFQSTHWQGVRQNIEPPNVGTPPGGYGKHIVEPINIDQKRQNWSESDRILAIQLLLGVYLNHD